MSSVDNSIGAEEADVLRQNALAILLKKSLRIHASSTASAMVQHMAAIEKTNPDFSRRILFVAIGSADQETLNAFRNDFQVLDSLAPNTEILPIDFRFIPEIPRRHIPFVPGPDDRAAMTHRTTLVVLMLFIIAFPRLNIPLGTWRVNCLELIASFHNDMKEQCLRIFCDVASQEDINTFDGLAEMAKGWIDGTDEHPGRTAQENAQDSEGTARADTVEPETLPSSQNSSVSVLSGHEPEDEDTDSSEDDVTIDPQEDMNSYSLRESEEAYQNIVDNLDVETYKAILRASKAYF